MPHKINNEKSVYIGSGNGSRNKPLPESMLTQIYDFIWIPINPPNTLLCGYNKTVMIKL